MKSIYETYEQEFEKVKTLDSRVFVAIPQHQIEEAVDYRRWLFEIEEKWMVRFNGDEFYMPRGKFNEEAGIGGQFKDIDVDHCKLYRYDGTVPKFAEDDYRGDRGFLIRDHYSKANNVKVHFITANLLEFLQNEGLEHSILRWERTSGSLD